MTTTASTTAAELLERLQRSNLLQADALAQVRCAAIEAGLAKDANVSQGSSPSGEDNDLAEQLAEALVQGGWITHWQAEQLLAGRQAFFFGKYKLLRRIGSGGMGSVYQAEEARLRRVVALKVLHPEKVTAGTSAARFRREIHAASLLQHPNIIQALDADRIGRTHYLVMEYVDGHDLGRWIRRNTQFPLKWTCEVIRQTALGLQHAHERGLVHRDIKPGNLLVCQEAARNLPHVKILDFGLARFMQEAPIQGDLTETGQILGTPDYIAPEQARNTRAADIRADIFSLGCTLYRMLAGRLPFEGENAVEKLVARYTSDAPPIRRFRPEVPPPLEGIVGTMLARDPDQRYPTPEHVAEVLAPFSLQPPSHSWSFQVGLPQSPASPPLLSTQFAEEQQDLQLPTDQQQTAAMPAVEPPAAPEDPLPESGCYPSEDATATPQSNGHAGAEVGSRTAEFLSLLSEQAGLENESGKSTARSRGKTLQEGLARDRSSSRSSRSWSASGSDGFSKGRMQRLWGEDKLWRGATSQTLPGWAWVMSVGLLAATTVLFGFWFSSAKTQPGSIRVRLPALVPDLQVFLDDRPVTLLRPGREFLISAATAGEHILRLERPGKPDTRRVVLVESGSQSLVVIKWGDLARGPSQDKKVSLTPPPNPRSPSSQSDSRVSSSGVGNSGLTWAQLRQQCQKLANLPPPARPLKQWIAARRTLAEFLAQDQSAQVQSAQVQSAQDQSAQDQAHRIQGLQRQQAAELLKRLANPLDALEPEAVAPRYQSLVGHLPVVGLWQDRRLLHESLVKWLAASPDGRWLASADIAGGVLLSDAKTGQPQASWRLPGRISGLSVQPQSKYFAILTNTQQGEGRVWLVFPTDFEQPHLLTPAVPQPTSLAALSGDHQQILVGTAEGTLALLTCQDRLPTGRPGFQAGQVPADSFDQQSGDSDAGGLCRVDELSLGTGPIELLTVDSQGRWLLTFSEGKFRLWPLAKLVDSLRQDRQPIQPISLDPDEPERFRQRPALLGSLSKPLATFSPDGRTLITAGLDGSFHLWTLPLSLKALPQQGLKPQRLPIPGRLVLAMQVSPDGQLLAIASRGNPSIRLWSLPGAQLVGSLSSLSTVCDAVAFLPAPQGPNASGSPASAGFSSGSEELESATSPAASAGIAEPTLVDRSRNTSRFALAMTDGSRVRVLDCANGSSVLQPTGHGRAVASMTWSQDSGQLISCGLDGTLLCWDPSTGAVQDSQQLTERGSVRAVGLTRDGRFVAALPAGRLNQVFWQATPPHPSGARLRRVSLLSRQPILQIGLSPDGEELVGICKARNRRGVGVQLWQMPAGVPSPGVFDQSQQVVDVLYSNDGRWVFVTTFRPRHPPRVSQLQRDPVGLPDDRQADQVRLPNLESPETNNLPLASGMVRLLDISPEGRWLLGYSITGRLLLWDLSGQQLLSRPLPAGPVTGVFSPAGTLAVLTSDGRVSLFKLPSDGRPLTEVTSAQLPAPQNNTSLRFSPAFSRSGQLLFGPEGRHLLVGDATGAILVLRWNEADFSASPTPSQSP